jgi:hypothetical protein
MRLPLEQMERVAAYLSGRMTPEQKARFESDLTMDSDLQDQLTFQKEMAQVIQRRALRAEIVAAGKSFGGSSGFSWNLFLGGIAVTVTSVAVYFLFIREPQKVSAQQTIASHQVNEADTRMNAITDEVTASGGDIQHSDVHSTQPTGRNAQPGPFTGLLPIVKQLTTSMPVEMPLEKAITRAEMVDFKQLNFTPKGFREKIAAYLPFEGHISVTPELEEELYYATAKNLLTENANGANSEITVETWKGSKQLWSRKYSGMGGHDRRSGRKKETCLQIIDAEGNFIPGVKISYSYFGEARTALSDSNGVIRFTLYSPIKTSVKLELPGGRVALAEQVRFEPKRVVFMKVSYVTRGLILKWEDLSNYYTYPFDCGGYVDPLAVKVIRSPKFRNTYLATSAFQERLRQLQTMENGQTLLEVYIDHLNNPLYEVDSIVAGLLDGELKAIFERFSEQRIGGTAPVNQLEYASWYREQRQQLHKEAYTEVPSKNSRQYNRKMMQELGKFVTPCRN